LNKKLIVALLLLGAVVVAYLLFQISRSRTYQFFGEIIPRVNTTNKAVALTFDDGPVPGGTEEILSILEQEQIHCTFFLTGAELEQNMEEGRKIVAAGHELGNHTYSHVRMLLVSPAFVKQEIESTDKLIRQAGYQGEILFRPPYGKKLFALPYYLSKNNRKTVTWDVEPNSFPEIDASADKTVEYVLQKTEPGSIIILHVMYSSRKESMKAVKGIVEGLRDRGYSFKTVSQLLAESH